MTGWKVTATTIYCRDIDDEVTLIMTDDGNISCTGMQMHFDHNRNGKKSAAGKHCQGPACSPMVEHSSKISRAHVRNP